MRGFVILITIFPLLLSCASFNPSMGIASFGQTAKETRQTIDGTVTTETFVVIPATSLNHPMGLKIGRLSLNEDIIRYYFRAEIHATNWIFADSIAVKIDDKIYRLQDNSPDRRVLHGNYVMEILTFNITPEMLVELRNASIFIAELLRRVVSVEGERLRRVQDFLQ